ncbi:MAG: SpoIIIAH-like family protein [Oscillospiraceae bacterium]|nr:SpoIIIAH-like family protein [Oscillospiraceae bacterium]
MNVIFGKKQILLATLVLALGIAIYLNWQFSETDGDFTITTNIEAEDEKNYGDAEFVSNSLTDTDTEVDIAVEDYFTEARYKRQQSRDEAVETLQKILSDTNISDADKDEAMMTATNLATAIDAESNIESLVKAKGFEDCIAYIDDDKASVVVKSNGLLDNEVAQIKDIIIRESKISAQNISIVPVK